MGKGGAEARRAMDGQTALIAEIEADATDTATWTGRDHFSRRVLDALRAVRRDAFVPADAVQRAWLNVPLPIGCDQTISQPFIVALMTDLLDLARGDRVLEVGTGSGYQAAILAALGARVFSIEVIPALADRARDVLAAQGFAGVALRCGDGAAGWPEEAPFDAIIVTAAAREVPTALVTQLRPGGRMVIPVGEPHGDQQLRLLTKSADGAVTDRGVLAVAFVPLTGNHAP